MTDLAELYQSVILDHNRRPRNRGELGDATAQADGKNPLCGDHLTVWVKLDGDTLADVRFVGQGCAISQASASLMTQATKGRTRSEAAATFDRVHAMLTGTSPAASAAGVAQPGDREALGALAALSGVSRFPVRVKCASLAWHTLRAALANADDRAHDVPDAVTTE